MMVRSALVSLPRAFMGTGAYVSGPSVHDFDVTPVGSASPARHRFIALHRDRYIGYPPASRLKFRGH